MRERQKRDPSEGTRDRKPLPAGLPPEQRTEPPLFAQNPIELTTNPEIDQIADALRTTPPKWDSILGKLDERDVSQMPHYRAVGKVGEIHVEEVARQVVEEKHLHVDFHPIQHEEVGGLVYENDQDGHLNVIDAVDGHKVTEYDISLAVDDVHLIGEVRITKERYPTDETKGLTPLLDEQTIFKKMDPVKRYYEGHIGQEDEKLAYMVVSVPDVISPDYVTGTYTGTEDPPPDTPEKEFINRGGILVALPFNSQEANQRVHTFFHEPISEEEYQKRFPDQASE